MYNDRSEEAEIKHLHFYDVKYAVLRKCVSNKTFWLPALLLCLFELHGVGLSFNCALHSLFLA